MLSNVLSVLYSEAPHPLGPARVCCDDWWATASLIVNFDLDFSICFTFHKSRLSFHLQMEIWKYPTGFCQLSFAWLRFVFTLRVTHFSSRPLDRGEWCEVWGPALSRQGELLSEGNAPMIKKNYLSNENICLFFPRCPWSAGQFLMWVCCMNITG